MKAGGLYVMSFLVIGTALASLVLCSQQEGTSTFPGTLTHDEEGMAWMMKSRKLMKQANNDKEDMNGGDIQLEDYRPLDPVPSSKASLRPGPVQHGTPLMPFIPKPAPPPGLF